MDNLNGIAVKRNPSFARRNNNVFFSLTKADKANVFLAANLQRTNIGLFCIHTCTLT